MKILVLTLGWFIGVATGTIALLLVHPLVGVLLIASACASGYAAVYAVLEPAGGSS